MSTDIILILVMKINEQIDFNQLNIFDQFKRPFKNKFSKYISVI